ncbi:MAG: pitrilysin family protein [Alphaproteobacteria bacterium]
MNRLSRRAFFLVPVFAFMTVALLPSSADAAATSRIERVVSKRGIEAWLVRQSNLPIIALDFAVRGGSAQDDAEKPGVAALTAAMLDEGAGDMDTKAFHERMEERAISLSFSAGRDTFGGSVRMLSEHRAEAFELLRLAITAPRFDQEPLDRTRQTMLAGLRRSSTSAGAIASEAFWAAAFPNHPYGRRPGGTLESLPKIDRTDLIAFHRRVLARESLKVAVVGDITPEDLATALDSIFGDLPETADLKPVPDVTMAAAGQRRVISLEVPQTVISFGLPGLKRDDPDFIPAFVLNQILGGGGMTSRLFSEVREKRGLAYSVSSGLTALDGTGLVTGGTSTRNDRAGESLAVIEAELKRIGLEGPTDEELASAKRYLIGSWALRFDTSNAIAGNLLRIRMDGFGPDYLDRRNGLIEAVTIEDLRRVAKRLFANGQPLVVAVGKPSGM